MKTSTPGALRDVEMHYCPGCGHGIINRLLAEVLDELQVRKMSIGVLGIGCYTFADQYIEADCLAALHGRAPAVATGMKRSLGSKALIFTYQGDGDAASIGMNELMQAATRGEKITVIMVNNTLYGMTGGQMGATTLLGQRTATTPRGRDEESHGKPLKVAEIMSAVEGVNYSARVAVNSPANVRKAKRALRRAMEEQLLGRGFNFIEILSQCPTGFRMNPVESAKWVKEELFPVYPPQEFKNNQQEGEENGQ